MVFLDWWYICLIHAIHKSLRQFSCPPLPLYDSTTTIISSPASTFQLAFPLWFLQHFAVHTNIGNSPSDRQHVWSSLALPPSVLPPGPIHIQNERQREERAALRRASSIEKSEQHWEERAALRRASSIEKSEQYWHGRAVLRLGMDMLELGDIAR